MRKILAVQSDTHGGCKLALMNPDTELIETGPEGETIEWTPEPTASQLHLWAVFTDGVQKVRDLADGSEVILFDIGDSTHGNKWAQELVSTRLDDQITIAERNLAPWMELPNLTKIRLVAGTGVHVFSEGAAPRMIAKYMRAAYPKVDCISVEHGQARVNGVLTDYAHHGPSTGARHWLSGNIARFYLRDLVQRALLDNKEPPQLVLRGHFHSPVYEYLEQGSHVAQLLVLPSFSMLGEHGRQATRSVSVITHGITAFEIEDGKILSKHRFYTSIDITTKEEL